MRSLPLEHEVEAAFCEEMSTWRHTHLEWPVVHWYERQVQMPFEGRADVVTTGPLMSYIVEVKRRAIDEKAVTQLVGYLGQVQRIVQRHATARRLSHLRTERALGGILVGKSITPYALRAAEAFDFRMYLYQVVTGRIVFEEIHYPIRSAWGQPYGGILGGLIENAIDSADQLYKDLIDIEGSRGE